MTSYPLGVDRDEIYRLHRQHVLWNERTAALWRKAGFRAGQRLLDVGAGCGIASVELAMLVGPEGSVTAIDRADPFLRNVAQLAESLGIRNVETRHADVDELQLEPCSVDGTWMRWVLCFANDPARVVRELAAALRPGGAAVFVEYADYSAASLAPDGVAFRAVIDAVERRWARPGGGISVGSRLTELVTSAGLRIGNLERFQAETQPRLPLGNYLAEFYKDYARKLVADGTLDAAVPDALDREFEMATSDPAARLHAPPLCELVAFRD